MALDHRKVLWNYLVARRALLEQPSDWYDWSQLCEQKRQLLQVALLELASSRDQAAPRDRDYYQAQIDIINQALSEPFPTYQCPPGGKEVDANGRISYRY